MQAAGTAPARANGQGNPHNRATRNGPKLSEDEQRALDRAGERTHVVCRLPYDATLAMSPFAHPEHLGAALRPRPANAPVSSCCRLCLHYVHALTALPASTFLELSAVVGVQRSPLVPGSMGLGDAVHPQYGSSSWLQAEPSSHTAVCS